MMPKHYAELVRIATEVVVDENTHPDVRDYFSLFLMEGSARKSAGPTLSFREGGNTRQKLRAACDPDISNGSRGLRICSLRVYVRKYLERRQNLNPHEPRTH